MDPRKSIVSLLKETWDEFQRDEAWEQGAALAYYTMFSIFPLLILLLAGFGFLLGARKAGADIRADLFRAIGQYFSPQLADSLKSLLEGLQTQAGAATGIGILTLLIGASGVFGQLEASFNKIWKVEGSKEPEGWGAYIIQLLRDRIFSFGMVLAVGLLLLVSLVLTGLTQWLLAFVSDLPLVGAYVGLVIGMVITLALDTLIFALLFKYLPKTKVLWSDVLLGALVTAVVWEIAKRLLALYIARSSYVSAYGAVGTALVIMIWVFFSSQVLFLGAEFTEVWSRRHNNEQVKARARS